MTSASACPRCGRPTVVVGHVLDGGESIDPPRFLPAQMQIKLFSQNWWGVELTAGFQACLTCGLTWSQVDGDALRSFILQHGSELACQQVDEFDGGPMRGLPDTAPARQVAANVAEIDHLVRSNKANEAVRRYRELTGVIWDQAIAATRSWRDLTREAKLELFGWITKKGELDDLADPWI